MSDPLSMASRPESLSSRILKTSLAVVGLLGAGYATCRLLTRRHSKNRQDVKSEAKTACRVLSVQSTVVHGYCGNKSAMFPLQLHGIEVDPLNSVQFSNHTGYALFTGQRVDAAHMWELVRGLQGNNFIEHYTHLLTGYVGSAEFLRKVVELLTILKKANPNLVYVLDPVMGDSGKLYVPADLVPVYVIELVPLANIITPNQTEAQLLTNITINNLDDAFRACLHLHQRGCETVVITSLDFGDGSVEVVGSTTRYLRPEDADNGRKSVNSDGIPEQYLYLRTPRFPGHYVGTGDLVASLLLVHLKEPQSDLKTAIETAWASTYAVVERTHNAEPKRSELAIVQSKTDIEAPVIRHRAVVLTPKQHSTR